MNSMRRARAVVMFGGVLGVAPVAAQVVTPRDRFVAESTAIARAALAIDTLTATERRAARNAAIATLNEPIAYERGSVVLGAGARARLDAKAWYLYLNPLIRLRVTGTADSGLTGEVARALAQARTDSVRTYLLERGIELSRMDVEEETSGSPPGSVSFRAFPDIQMRGDDPWDVALTTLDTPPAGAAPPAPERTGPALSSPRRRYPWGVVRIFYATDRRRGDTTSVDGFYSGDRSATASLEFGRVEVTIPRVHRPGHVERPVWYRLERLDESRHLSVRRIQRMTQRATLDSLRQVVSASGAHEALVFIHGYNVPFRDAALRTAQLTYDLAFDGAPILYSWPSRGSLFQYSADREAAEWSAQHLRVFLDSVVAVTGAARVNVVAHSMGNRALTLALEQMHLARQDTVFANVVLAAADVDATRFTQQLAASILPLTRRLTIYQSSKDKALWASRFLSTNLRLGEATDPMLVTRGADTIDASLLKTDMLGHGYVASSSQLIDDMVLLLREKRAVPRGPLQRVDTSLGPFWRFP